MARTTPRVVIDPQGRRIDIRHWQTGDGALSIPFLQTIAGETHFTNNHAGRTFGEPEAIDSDRIGTLDDQHQVQPLAFAGGQMVGQLVCVRLDATHPYLGHIARFGMMVRREFWGSGVARALIDEMETFVVASGIVRVEAMVRADNARGRAFYQRHGFREEGVRTMAARIADGFVDDVFIAKIYRDA